MVVAVVMVIALIATIIIVVVAVIVTPHHHHHCHTIVSPGCYHRGSSAGTQVASYFIDALCRHREGNRRV